jgi:hypothetical protein
MSGGAGTGGHGLVAVADAGAFLARLVRFEPGALVRLRAAEVPGAVRLWGRLPWDVLVTRAVAGDSPGDVTVEARALLAALTAGSPALPPRRDERWHWALPPGGGVVVESVPAAQVRVLGAAAAQAVRSAAARGVGGRAVGERAIRDALLDHVAIVASMDAAATGSAGTEGAGTEGAGTDAADASPLETGEVPARGDKSSLQRVPVSQRLVQAVVRMGFLRPNSSDDETPVRVLISGGYVGLAAEYGVAWHRRISGPSMYAIVRTDEPR